MSVTIFYLLIASNILLLGLCGYLLYDRWCLSRDTKDERSFLNDDIYRYKEEICKSRLANDKLRELLTYKKETPSDCKEGRWCGACQFGKLMMVYSDYGSEEAYYFCTKAQCCDYWTERKGFDDGD